MKLENSSGLAGAKGRGAVYSVPSPNTLEEEGRWIVARSLETQLQRIGPGITVVPETSSCAAGWGYKIELPAGQEIRFRDVWQELPPQTLPGWHSPGMPYRIEKAKPNHGMTMVAEQLELFELAEIAN